MSVLSIAPITAAQAPEDLLLDADPSRERVAQYLAHSQCFGAILDNRVVGVCVLSRLKPDIFEIMNIAVAQELQSSGIGTRLLKHVIEQSRNQGGKILQVGTGTFGEQLIFYQKLGFRAEAVWRDHFSANYPQPLIEHGIQHRDMLRLTMNLTD